MCLLIIQIKFNCLLLRAYPAPVETELRVSRDIVGSEKIMSSRQVRANWDKNLEVLNFTEPIVSLSALKTRFPLAGSTPLTKEKNPLYRHIYNPVQYNICITLSQILCASLSI